MSIVIEKARPGDLPELNKMYRRVVARMFETGLDLWNDYYPTDELPDDIAAERLYVIRQGDKIAAAFALFDRVPAQHCFEWQNPDADVLYVGRLGVHPDCARQGFGGMVLDTVFDMARTMGMDAVRLLVAIENTPAMGLYRKNGFTQVSGQAVEYYASLGRDVTELGFEKVVD